MLNTKLIPRTWPTFFDDLSRVFRQDDVQRYAMVRISGPDLLGSRDVAPWLEFEQIAYDPEARTLRLSLNGFDHQVDDPGAIWAAVEADGNVERLVAIGRDGSRDYIEFSKYHRASHDGDSGRSRLESVSRPRGTAHDMGGGARKVSDPAGRRLAG